jgi:hypothetical protein
LDQRRFALKTSTASAGTMSNQPLATRLMTATNLKGTDNPIEGRNVWKMNLVAGIDGRLDRGAIVHDAVSNRSEIDHADSPAASESIDLTGQPTAGKEITCRDG